jgi:hypothetical protein
MSICVNFTKIGIQDLLNSRKAYINCDILMCEMSMISHRLDSRFRDSGEIVSLTLWPRSTPPPPRKIPGTHLYLWK